jgi:hypothetical protein
MSSSGSGSVEIRKPTLGLECDYIGVQSAFMPKRTIKPDKIKELETFEKRIWHTQGFDFNV